MRLAAVVLGTTLGVIGLGLTAAGLLVVAAVATERVVAGGASRKLLGRK